MRQILVVTCMCGLSGLASAQPLDVVSHAVRYDSAAQTVLFEIEFNRKPDFFTLDAGGRQADSWQINMDTVQGINGFGGNSPYIWETIARGEEIHTADKVRIRNHILGPSPEPISGGWGPVAGSYSYSMVGARQAFTIPYSALNTTTGAFRFELECYQFGVIQPHVIRGNSVPMVPAPAASGMLIPGGMVLFRRRRAARA